MSLNTMEQYNILQVVEEQESRIRKLEGIFTGQGIDTARIADAAIIDAKIESLSVEKLTTGTLSVGVAIYIRNEADTANQGIIGYQAGGF